MSCEKPMSHSAADGVAMVEAAKRTGRIVQIGSQRVSSLVCKKAKEMVAQGMLGDLMMVEGWLGRNDPTGAWEYPPPTDLSPQALDWDTWQGNVAKRPFDPYIFARFVRSPALTHEDRAAGNELPGKSLDAEPLRIRITTIARAAYTFFVCHKYPFSKFNYSDRRTVKRSSRFARL